MITPANLSALLLRHRANRKLSLNRRIESLLPTRWLIACDLQQSILAVRKKEQDLSLKIIVVTDLHIGSVPQVSARPYLDNLMRLLSHETNVDLFILGGDIINGGTSQATFGAMWEEAERVFSLLPAIEADQSDSLTALHGNAFVAVGNHDWEVAGDQDPQRALFLGFTRWCAHALQVPLASDDNPVFSFTFTNLQLGIERHGPWRFTMLQSYDEYNTNGSRAPRNKIDVPLLKASSGDVLEELKVDPVPTILFSHAPIKTYAPGPTAAPLDPETHKYLDRNMPGYALPDGSCNPDYVCLEQRLVEGGVRLAISGHTHAFEQIFPPNRRPGANKLCYINAGSVCGRPYYGTDSGEPFQGPSLYTRIEIEDLSDPRTIRATPVYLRPE